MTHGLKAALTDQFNSRSSINSVLEDPVQFLAPIQQLATICFTSSKASMVSSDQDYTPTHKIQIKKQNNHLNNKKQPLLTVTLNTQRT